MEQRSVSDIESVDRVPLSLYIADMWNLPAPKSFRGFDEHLPVRIYHRHLPHWRQEGVTYFVTFRLADSLPQGKLRELARLRQQWLNTVGRSSAPSSFMLSHQDNGPFNAQKKWKDVSEAWIEQIEGWLDQGSGSCMLRTKEAAAAIERCLRHDDGERYELIAFVVMPNHVHVLARPYSDRHYPLEKLEQNWKSFSAREINRHFRRVGPIWQSESFDRIVRDEEHLFRCLQYIGSNPRRAGLKSEDCIRYVSQRWLAAGWAFQVDA
jgi:REP element-mobilizing transposase RayT